MRDTHPAGTGASTEKRTERPLHHVLSHLRLHALHRLRLKLSLVCCLYPVDLFKHLLDASLTLRARCRGEKPSFTFWAHKNPFTHLRSSL